MTENQRPVLSETERTEKLEQITTVVRRIVAEFVKSSQLPLVNLTEGIPGWTENDWFMTGQWLNIRLSASDMVGVRNDDQNGYDMVLFYQNEEVFGALQTRLIRGIQELGFKVGPVTLRENYFQVELL